MIELSVSETKRSSLLARTCALILYISIWIFDFGPEKLAGLSRNGPQQVLFTSCFGNCGSRAEVVSRGNFCYPSLSSVLFTYGDNFELNLLLPGLVNMFLWLQSSRLVFRIINTDFSLLGISPRIDLTKRTFYRSKNFPSLIELCCEKGKFTERACTANVILGISVICARANVSHHIVWMLR